MKNKAGEVLFQGEKQSASTSYLSPSTKTKARTGCNDGDQKMQIVKRFREEGLL